MSSFCEIIKIGLILSMPFFAYIIGACPSIFLNNKNCNMREKLQKIKEKPRIEKYGIKQRSKQASDQKPLKLFRNAVQWKLLPMFFNLVVILHTSKPA